MGSGFNKWFSLTWGEGVGALQGDNVRALLSLSLPHISIKSWRCPLGQLAYLVCHLAPCRSLPNDEGPHDFAHGLDRDCGCVGPLGQCRLVPHRLDWQYLPIVLNCCALSCFSFLFWGYVLHSEMVCLHCSENCKLVSKINVKNCDKTCDHDFI